MSNPDFSALRAAMVASQLRTNAITNASLLAAMESVPREAFLPKGKEALAYVDVALPLGDGRAIPAPLATARLIQELGAVSGRSILLIGAATGYAAALLDEMGAIIVAVESSAELAAQCRHNLSGRTIAIVDADLASGVQGNDSFDALLIDGAVSHVPDALISLLKDGAAISTGMIEAGVTRVVRGTKTNDSAAFLAVMDMELPELPGFARPLAFSF